MAWWKRRRPLEEDADPFGARALAEEMLRRRPGTFTMFEAVCPRCKEAPLDLPEVTGTELTVTCSRCGGVMEKRPSPRYHTGSEAAPTSPGRASAPPLIPPSAPPFDAPVVTHPPPVFPASRVEAEALPDLGSALLDSLASRTGADEQWCQREDRSFTWWSHRLAQRISVEEPRRIEEAAVVCVRATMDVVVDVGANEAMVAKVLDSLNQAASLGALVWSPARRSVFASTTAYFSDRSPEGFFAVAMLMQNCEAHARVDGLAAILGGRPADVPHPTSGHRSEPDGKLVVAQELMEMGQSASVFAGPVLAGLPHDQNIPWVMATGDETGMSGELLFADGTPAIVAAASGSPPGTALVQVVTGASHPAYGNGLLMLMRLPITRDRDAAAALALALNRSEAEEWTGFSQFGAWCTDASSGTTLCYATFLPNLNTLLAALWTLAADESLRCGWAAGRLGPH